MGNNCTKYGPAECDDLHVQIAELEGENERLENEAVSLANHNASLRANITGRDTTIAELETERSDLGDNFLKVDYQRREAKAKYLGMREQVRKAEAEAAAERIACAGFEADNKWLRGHLSSSDEATLKEIKRLRARADRGCHSGCCEDPHRVNSISHHPNCTKELLREERETSWAICSRLRGIRDQQERELTTVRSGLALERARVAELEGNVGRPAAVMPTVITTVDDDDSAGNWEWLSDIALELTDAALNAGKPTGTEIKTSGSDNSVNTAILWSNNRPVAFYLTARDDFNYTVTIRSILGAAPSAGGDNDEL